MNNTSLHMPHAEEKARQEEAARQSALAKELEEQKRKKEAMEAAAAAARAEAAAAAAARAEAEAAARAQAEAAAKAAAAAAAAPEPAPVETKPAEGTISIKAKVAEEVKKEEPAKPAEQEVRRSGSVWDNTSFCLAAELQHPCLGCEGTGTWT